MSTSRFCSICPSTDGIVTSQEFAKIDGKAVPEKFSKMRTKFSVLSTTEAGEASCLRLIPETGLKHQLRIQCDRYAKNTSRGFPIF